MGNFLHHGPLDESANQPSLPNNQLRQDDGFTHTSTISDSEGGFTEPSLFTTSIHKDGGSPDLSLPINSKDNDTIHSQIDHSNAQPQDSNVYSAMMALNKSEATNNELTTTKPVVLSKLGKPRATDITHDSIELNLLKPEQGAHDITSYTVFYQSTSNSHDQWMHVKTDTADERATVSNLSENNTYLFKVWPDEGCEESNLESNESAIKT